MIICTKSGCESKSPRRVFIEGKPFCQNHGFFGLAMCSAKGCKSKARTFMNGEYTCLRHGSIGTCSICMEDCCGESGCETTHCGHLFHKTCLHKWYNIGEYSCPLCRSENVDLALVMLVMRYMEVQT